MLHVIFYRILHSYEMLCYMFPRSVLLGLGLVAALPSRSCLLQGPIIITDTISGFLINYRYRIVYLKTPF